MEPPRSSSRRGWLAAAVVAVVAVAAVWAVWRARPALVTEESVRSTILTTLATETPEEFVVTGRLTAGTTTETARRWRLKLLDLETGRSTVEVRLPGEVTYGFPLGALRPDDIAYLGEGIVEIRMPALTVFSVEPVLEEATVDARVSGTARLTPELTEQTLQQALRGVRPALRQQAERHLATSRQPRQNTARALRRMLATPLAAAGVRDVRYRFIVAPGDTLTLSDDGQTQTLAAP